MTDDSTKIVGPVQPRLGLANFELADFSAPRTVGRRRVKLAPGWWLVAQDVAPTDVASVSTLAKLSGTLKADGPALLLNGKTNGWLRLEIELDPHALATGNLKSVRLTLAPLTLGLRQRIERIAFVSRVEAMPSTLATISGELKLEADPKTLTLTLRPAQQGELMDAAKEVVEKSGASLCLAITFPQQELSCGVGILGLTIGDDASSAPPPKVAASKAGGQVSKDKAGAGPANKTKAPGQTTTSARAAPPSKGPKASAARDKAPGGDINTAEGLAALTPDRIARKFAFTTNAKLVRETVTLLYRSGGAEKIWRIHEAIPELAEGEISPKGYKYAYLQLFYCRTMLAMNAAETAFLGLDRLLSSPVLLSGLDDTDVPKSLNVMVRAALRSGRTARAAEILRRMTVEHPTDWEAYFQLANLAGAEGLMQRRQYLELAEHLAPKFPADAQIAVAEACLEEGLVQEALTRALTILKRHPDHAEVFLTLGNIYLAMGDRDRWAAYMERFFRAYETQSRIEVAPGSGEHVFDEVRRADAPMEKPDSSKAVTVIMTTFNSATTVERAIASVLAQTYPNVRLVVVDDVSSDETVAIVKRAAAADRRVTLRISDENRGTYCAKNSALHEFPSDYYAFHDSDDWMHPDRILEHVAAMEADPGLACTYSSWFRMDERGYAIARRGGGYLHDNPASTFFPRSVVEEVGYFDSVRTGADSELIWRIRRRFGAAAVRHIKKPLAIGLHHSESLTTKGAAAFDEHRFSPVRLKYWESWIGWHRGSTGTEGRLFVAYPLTERPFEAPEEIAPERPTASGVSHPAVASIREKRVQRPRSTPRPRRNKS